MTLMDKLLMDFQNYWWAVSLRRDDSVTRIKPHHLEHCSKIMALHTFANQVCRTNAFWVHLAVLYLKIHAFDQSVPIFRDDKWMNGFS